MTILNVGSINWDRVFNVPHFPQPGETLSALSVTIGLGGKGLNQTVAIARAGGAVRHVGAVGETDIPIREALAAAGIDHTLIAGVAGVETGSATIFVDSAGENLIVLDQGANARVPDASVRVAVEGSEPGDWLLFQNETNQTETCARLAREQGLKVCYSAAPFLAETVVPLLPMIDLLSVNAIELAQLTEAIGGMDALPDGLAVLVTRGADGADYIAEGKTLHVDAHRVDVVDTTGAGDVFLGVFLAELDAGAAPQDALTFASAASALQVGKLGATDVIPLRNEIEAFLRDAGHRRA